MFVFSWQGRYITPFDVIKPEALAWYFLRLSSIPVSSGWYSFDLTAGSWNYFLAEAFISISWLGHGTEISRLQPPRRKRTEKPPFSTPDGRMLALLTFLVSFSSLWHCHWMYNSVSKLVLGHVDTFTFQSQSTLSLSSTVSFLWPITTFWLRKWVFLSSFISIDTPCFKLQSPSKSRKG